MKRTVKLVAVDNRYKVSTYPYRCIQDDSIGTYRTGQHIDPKDPDSRDNLTADEMTGKVMLSPEKQKRFPHVINPLTQINFFNGQTFDLSKDKQGNYVNPKDAALIKLLRDHGYMTANSRDEVIMKKHFFYIKDDIFEAQTRINKSDLTYQAEKFVREEVEPEALKEIGLVLAYKVKEFIYDPDATSDLILKDKIIDLCKTKPEKVLECKSIGTKEDIFVLKLSINGIIKRRGTDFYDGSKFIGKDIDNVKKFMSFEENTALVSKWSKLLAEKEKRVPVKEQDSSEINVKEEVYDKIKDKSYNDLRRMAGQKRLPKDEWESYKTKEEMIKYLLSKS